MQNAAITPDVIRKHGITDEEYRRIQEILGRDPNITELGIFSVMWSEHCSYKNSRPELKKFPTTGERVLVKAGEENAGVIDIGDGWAIAFKIESHNHPSAIEPFQGAATGVGGIIRDIFTMGARPVFSLNSLRFGEISGVGDLNKLKHNRRLFAGVVAGIAHYGNCIGIPTIGGEVYFDEAYEGNPLVNAFCLGVLRHEQIARGAAKGIGNPVFYVGAETGRDGLAGAAFASRDLTEESKEDRPAVQVGDPFKEKLLLEACLELLETGAVAGIQDMGAAGLTCSTCETAARAGTGVEIELTKVPRREPGMTPYETMLSESQERMLIIVEKGKEEAVTKVFDKWDLPYAEIGVVTGDGMMRVKDQGETVAEIPAAQLANDAPVYHREWKPRPSEPLLQAGDVTESDPAFALPSLLEHPTIASKNWVYRQYDHMVRTGTIVWPGSDAAVFRIREADKIIAGTTDCNGLYCKLDPREGGRIAVAEAARNLTCSGAVPLAVTDNLNFGNPHRPENFWQLREAVEGIAEACKVFSTPVTGGNVSLYNENPEGPIDPTPTIAMVGLVENEKHVTTAAFKDEGDAILLVGEIGSEIGGSQYLKVLHGRKEGLPPRLFYERELEVQNAVRALIRMGIVKSAHDCSEGGLAVAIAESCMSSAGKLGASINIDAQGRPDILLFNEAQSRIVISTSKANAAAALAMLEWRKVPARRLGTVQGKELIIQVQEREFTAGNPLSGAGKDEGLAGRHFRWRVEDLHDRWYQSISRSMNS